MNAYCDETMLAGAAAAPEVAGLDDPAPLSPVVLAGGPDAPEGWLAAAGFERRARDRVWVLGADDELRDYRALAPLFDWIESAARWQDGACAAVCRDAMPIVRRARNGASGEAQRGVGAVQAIVRRLSRESIGLSGDVDRLAALLLEAQRACGESWTLVVEDLRRTDRPSLRVLCRLAALSGPGGAIRMLWRADSALLQLPAPPAGEDIAGRLAFAQSALFARLRSALRISVVQGEGPGGRAARAAGTGAPADVVGDIGHAIAAQNFDRAYLLAERAWNAPLTDARRAEICRLVAITDVNVGNVQGALDMAARARDLADTPARQAHLSYLLGLVTTKRKHALEAARGHFLEGLAFLAGTAETQETLFERCWIENGLALVACLQAKGLPQAEQAASLQRIVHDEIATFERVLPYSTPEFLYLRYNLLANIAFLLEIMREYRLAIHFWERTLGEQAAMHREDPGAIHFDVVYEYRLGVLEAKAGDVDTALARLARSGDTARALGLAELEARVLYAQGFYAMQARRPGPALDAFRAGLLLAWRRRDWQACTDHARALHALACDAGLALDPPQRRACLALAAACARATGADVRGEPAAPPPKLPAYLPHIDLDSTADVDLNRKLVGASFTSADAGG